MSLYNMLHGVNPLAAPILATLHRHPNDFSRMRDAWIEKNEKDEPIFCIFTRNGGNNRSHYTEGVAAGPDCACTGCTMTHKIPKFEGYLRDEDDPFDSTYAYVYFKVPDEITADPELYEKLKALAIPHEDMQVKTDRAVAALKASTP